MTKILPKVANYSSANTKMVSIAREYRTARGNCLNAAIGAMISVPLTGMGLLKSDSTASTIGSLGTIFSACSAAIGWKSMKELRPIYKEIAKRAQSIYHG